MPSPFLQNKAAREILERLIPPLISRGTRIMALKILWLTTPADAVPGLWQNILPLRTTVDDLVKSVHGIHFFVSSITASASTTKKKKSPQPEETGSRYLNRPAIGYWILSENADFNDRELFNLMNKNNLGASMKLALQPFQRDEKSVCNVLCALVKDNWDGMVRRVVAGSVEAHPGYSSPDAYNILKVFVAKGRPELATYVTEMCNELTHTAAFPLTLQTF